MAKIRSTPNFDRVIGPHSSLCGWSRMSKFQFKMAAAAILENVGNAITRLPMDRFEQTLGGRIPLRPRLVHCDTVAMVMAIA